MQCSELVSFALCSQCLMIVVWLFLMVPRVCLQFVIVVSRVHTHQHAIDPFERQLAQFWMSTGLLFVDNWVLYRKNIFTSGLSHPARGSPFCSVVEWKSA